MVECGTRAISIANIERTVARTARMICLICATSQFCQVALVGTSEHRLSAMSPRNDPCVMSSIALSLFGAPVVSRFCPLCNVPSFSSSIFIEVGLLALSHLLWTTEEIKEYRLSLGFGGSERRLQNNGVGGGGGCSIGRYLVRGSQLQHSYTYTWKYFLLGRHTQLRRDSSSNSSSSGGSAGRR